MKKIILFVFILSSTMFLKAQTPEDASGLIYYERYASAESAMHKLLQHDAANAAAWYVLTEA
ncbi:MAG: hypothetical protein ACJ75F_05420, partial [Flavisolibacter sp.]